MSKLNMGFGEFPFYYEVKASIEDDDTEKVPHINNENIGTWLGFESLIPCTENTGAQFMQGTDVDFNAEGQMDETEH